MIEVSSESLKDFQICNRLFFYRHVEQRPDLDAKVTPDVIDHFEQTIKQIITLFFYKKQGGAILSYQSLLKRWEKIWFPKNTTAYEISTEIMGVHPNKTSFAAQAANIILSFYEDFEDGIEFPLLISEEFFIPYTSDIRIKGIFDVVLRDPTNNEIKVIFWNLRKNYRNISIIDFVFAKLAYKYRYPDMEGNIQFYLYDFTSNNRMQRVHIKESDVNAVEYWIQQMVEDRVYPSRRGLTNYCNKCPYDQACKVWSENWPSLVGVANG